MIFDEVAEALGRQSIRKISRVTGLKRNRVQSIRAGCTFVLDYEMVAALRQLGYDIKLEKVSGFPDIY